MRALRVVQEQSSALRARVASEVSAALRRDPASGARAAHEAMETEGSRALARSHGPVPACAAGCSWCCHVNVEATGPEILAVAEHITGTWSAEAIAALVATLAGRAREDLDDQARWAARIPCALLDDGGRCTVHPARPLRCRAFHSCDVEPCREAFEGRDEGDPVMVPALRRANDAVEAGYDDALAAAGLTVEGERLEIGLHQALTGRRATGA